MAYCIYTQAENILTKLKDCPAYQKRIEYTMSSLKAILLDAEEKQEQNQRLHDWLKELQNVFYQVEDSIDEFKWEFFKQKDTGKQVLAHFSCSSRISANKLKQNFKRNKVCDELNKIAAKMYEFHLKVKHIGSISMETTHSFPSASEISTRHLKPSWQLLYPLKHASRNYDEAYDGILNVFNKYTHGFFHIVGEAGIGKSTMARFLYNHENVVDRYTRRYWVCVEEGFNTHRLVKEVYSHADNEETREDLTTEQLLSKFIRLQREETFLLVFQDLSITNLDKCSTSVLIKLLEMGHHDSKIIVTTQTEEIAKDIDVHGYKTEIQSKKNLANGDEVSADKQSLTKNTQNQAVPGSQTEETAGAIANMIYETEKNLEKNPVAGDRESESSRLITKDAQNLDVSIPQVTECEPDRGYQTIFKLKKLSKQSSSLLFKEYAFRNSPEVQNPELTKIVDQLLEKCMGVPLAIKCLGSLLSSKTSIAEWKNIEKKLMPQEKKEDGILHVLRVCYDQMPSQLKPCFLYCSQLPNDRIFSSNDMIQLWMANGLLHSPEEKNLAMENIGKKYFMELWSRCFIQEIEEHGLGYWIKLHPLIQKLAHKITQEQSEGSWGNNHSKEITEIRSIAFQERNMVLPNASLTEKCIWRYKCLRLLYLGNADLQEIPNSIGTLKYLRYLDLHGNQKIKHLPDSICDLQSLQTLILDSCSALEDLPKDIRNLISLRYLWVTTNKLHLHKNGVGTMTSLRFLAIGGCKNLENLFERPDCLAGLETLMIYNCNTLKLLPNEMRYLKSLQNLMIWRCKQLTLNLEEVEFKLQRFTVKELPKVESLPRWLENSIETLRTLQIINCPIRLMELPVDKKYRALEIFLIHGSVRFDTMPGYDFEHRNLTIFRGNEMNIRY
ncbi:hypothetical protein IC582_009067 [Cucumis melo]